jgi:histidinol-phosphate aminotransferase
MAAEKTARLQAATAYPFADWKPELPERVARLTSYSAAAGSGAPEQGTLRRLHANELPWGEPWNRYPDSTPWALRAALGRLNELPAEAVFTANGSDEIIDLLQRALAEPGRDAVLLAGPTFPVYAHAAAVNGLEVLRVELDEHFALDADSALQAAGPQVKLAFLCDPNNPSGNRMGEEALYRFVQGFRGIVVLDEAYGEFAGADHRAWLREFPHLLLLRTLSKAWGLAGIRLGYALGHPALIEALDRVRMPYSISLPAQRMALQALENPGRMQRRVQTVVRARDRLARELARCPAVEQVYPSQANFLLLRCRDAEGLEAAARAAGLQIRRFSGEPRLNNCLRISVGSAVDNRRLLQVFTQYPVCTS